MSSSFWSALCLAGLWGGIFCTILLILKAFPARDRFDGRSALQWGGAGLVCFAIWILGMTQA
ncbi:hypothetical protein [Geomonas ferrireducens]|uniref:hypothetical protein n=1 Tax=Geomonas ferrireducens TaxID=2570227 RepID=UPI0010A803C0|nr:hypothetical protein [Geomonas ferrireducens]